MGATRFNNWYRNHEPMICLVGGIALMTVGGIFIGVQTSKAVEIINTEKERRGVDKLPFKDTLGLTWKLYLPCVGMMGAGVGALSRGYVSSAAALSSTVSMYKEVEQDYKNYLESAREVLGDKKLGEIDGKIVEKLFKDNPPPKEIPAEILEERERYVQTSGTKNIYPILDSHSGRYFWSNKDKLDAIEARLNLSAAMDDWVPLNDFYDEVGLKRTKDGDTYGFRCCDSRDACKFKLIAGEVTPEGEPAFALEYDLKCVYID